MRMSLWPQSLLGRLIAASVLAVLVAQIIGIALVAREREYFVLQGNVREWSRRIAEVTFMLQPLNAAEREAVITRLIEQRRWFEGPARGRSLGGARGNRGAALRRPHHISRWGRGCLSCEPHAVGCAGVAQPLPQPGAARGDSGYRVVCDRAQHYAAAVEAGPRGGGPGPQRAAAETGRKGCARAARSRACFQHHAGPIATVSGQPDARARGDVTRSEDSPYPPAVAGADALDRPGDPGTVRERARRNGEHGARGARPVSRTR